MSDPRVEPFASSDAHAPCLPLVLAERYLEKGGQSAEKNCDVPVRCYG